MHRNYSRSPERECIWWALYQGDRFVSLLLGLPYSITDSHCSIHCDGSSHERSVLTKEFLIRCSIVAGKLIDRNQETKEQPLSVIIAMDEDMESLAQTMSLSWWDISTMSIQSSDDAEEALKRLLTQVYFFHVRMYLHLPLMIKSRSDPRYEHNMQVCIESARKLVKRYHILRSKASGRDLFDCKTNDFVGFTASVVLLLLGHVTDLPGSQIGEEDLRLLSRSNMIFHQLAAPPSCCKIALQCHSALSALTSAAVEIEEDFGVAPEPMKIFIPYFGTILIPRKKRRRPAANYEPADQVNDVLAMDLPVPGQDEPAIAAENHPTQDCSLQGSIGFGLSDASAFSEWYSPTVDINDDWSLFLVENEDGWLIDDT